MSFFFSDFGASDFCSDLGASAGSAFFSRTGVPAALIASTSCGFFMEPAPLMPRPFAIAFRSATSMVERPPARFLGAVVASGVSVT